MTKYELQLLTMYRQMLLIRLCEEAFVEPILSGEIRCPVHLCSGQEAISVGICYNLEPTDIVFGNHRSHGHYLAKTGDLQGLIAEVFCRKTGCSAGRGGSMHLYCPEKGFYGSVPIVAGTVSLAVGAALASTIRNTGQVVVSFFGDGAVGEGVIYESLNFAALKKLPILFVCENNLYATHMPIDECRVNRDIYSFVSGLGVPAVSIDGNDIETVNSVSAKAIAACRNDNSPFFLECKTYRLRGHVGPDDNIQGTHTDIRPLEEITEWQKKDPIIRMKNILLERKLLTKNKEEKIQQEISNQVSVTMQKAKSESQPLKSDLYDHVF
ncbi:MAG: thiamine pyrophosphate-dependent dehydrogenase E1 component subunit alpha [Planctomycetaceae bacterium]|jgi:pyruvate dehydrogenase E1 component alpha subunit|nr:thiamine pyrophosphate-dependent dehydrogenase E1 component subunit alpha [Planctomycetaceae bacterium]